MSRNIFQGKSNNYSMRPNRAGPQGGVNMNTVYSNLSNAGLQPRRSTSLEDIDRANKNLDYTDLAADYNDRNIPKFGDELTAALLNARNSVHLTVLAPLYYTDEYNFVIKRGEVLQLPFDRVAPGSIARITSYNTSERFATLDMFKRSLRYEITKLEDPNFGGPAFEQGLQSLRTQAEMTLSGMVAVALVDVPYLEMISRYTNPIRSFSHSREMLLKETEQCFLGNRAPSDLIQLMISKRNTYNKMDTAILPGGAMSVAISNAAESRPMPAYKIMLSSSLHENMLVAYDGAMSLRSVTLGDGSVFHITENYAQRISIEDGEEDELQALRTEITLAEMATMPIRPVDQPFPMKPHALDIAIADHQENDLIPRRITLAQHMDDCILFLNGDGTPADAEGSAKTTITEALVKEYNTKYKEDVYQYFRNPKYANNNDEPPSEYNRSGLALAQMYGFRHYDAFVRYSDATEELEVPTFVGDLEPKTFSVAHAQRMSEYLEKHGGFTDFDPSVDKDADGVDAKPWKRLFDYTHRVLPTTLNDNKYVPATFVTFVTKVIEDHGGNDFDTVDIKVAARPANPDHKFSARAKGTSFRSSTASPLMPQMGETAAAYVARLSPDVIMDGISTGAIATGWSELFSHTADPAIEPVLHVAYEAHSKPMTAQDETALHALLGSMEEYSGRAHTKHIADKALANIRSNNNSVAALAPADGAPWFNTTAESRLNQTAQPSTDFSTAVREIHANTDVFFAQEKYGAKAAPTYVDPADGKTKGDKFKSEYTWKTFNAAKSQLGTAMQKYFYTMILMSTFTRKTVTALARVGLELFRVNSIKMGIHLQVESVAIMRAGVDTMQMALGHVIVTTGVDADAGYLTVNAQFHAGIICYEPAYMDMIPFALTHRFLGGRNNRAIKSQMELFDTHVSRNSRLCVPVPVTETIYNYPVALDGTPAYAAPNTEGVNAFQKGSWRDRLNVMCGDFYEGMSRAVAYRENSSFFETSPFCNTLHRACVWSYNERDEMRPIPGTGALGPIGCNVPGAARVFNGVGIFPTDYEQVHIV